MADRSTVVRVPLGKQGHSAYMALGDDELRRWETHCRGLEDGEVYPWAAQESRALVASILGCLFGEDLSHLEGPSRAWARTNSTMAIFTRRLGCLRELIGQESMMNGPDSFDRLQEIFDKVTIVATEAALVSLAYVSVSPHESNGRAPEADPTVVVSDSPEDDASRRAPSRWRRRTLLGLVMVAIAALVAGVALALTPPSTVHHPRGPKAPGHTTSTHGASTAKNTTGRSPSSPVGSGSGTTGQPRSSSSATPGGASGVSRTGPGTVAGNTPTQTHGTNTGTTGPGASPGQGGATAVTLPGGAQLTVPHVTIP